MDLYKYSLSYTSKINDASIRGRQKEEHLHEIDDLIECYQNGPFNKDRVRKHLNVHWVC